MGQEVLTTWKNTGDTPIRMVAAEIKPVNADGSPRQSFHYTLYAEFDDSPGVAPGETYTTKPGHGFKLPGFEGMVGYLPASSVDVRVTRVSEHSGL